MFRRPVLSTQAFAIALLGALTLLAVTSGAAAEDHITATARASEGGGFARIELTFPDPQDVSARITGSVLIIEFGRPVRISPEKLIASVPGFVAAARVDPGERSIRFALTRSVKVDLKDAAERVFVDLLPESWRGPPPPLPAEVVRDLARRAREAQTTPRAAELKNSGASPNRIGMAVAEAGLRLRLTFQLDDPERAQVEQSERNVAITFPPDASLDAARVRAALAGHVEAVQVDESPKGQVLRLVMKEARKARVDHEDGLLTVDLDRPAPPAAEAPPAGAPSAPSPAPEPPRQGVAEQEGGVQPAASGPVPPDAGPSAPSGADVAVAVSLKAVPGGVRMNISPRTHAAVLERNGEIWAVIQSARSVRLPAAGASERTLVAAISAEHLDTATLVRVKPLESGLLGVSTDGEGWSVDIGEAVGATAAPIRLASATGADGRAVLRGNLPQAGEAIWLNDPQSGGRVAVLTTLGPPHASLAPQLIAEAAVLQTALGFAIVALAEDLMLTPGLDGFVIARSEGLFLTRPAKSADDGPRSSGETVIVASQWLNDTRGSARETGRELLRAAADAAKRDRTGARLRYAQFLLANHLGREAAGVLGLIASEDTVAANERALLLLRAVAAVQTGDLVEARKFLSQPSLAMEAEAILWRAYLDATERRFGPAVSGFRQAAEVLDRYPDALQTLIRPAAAMAALESGDAYLAGRHAGELERLDADMRDPGLLALVQGRIAEAAGRTEEAAAAYAQAAKSPSRPVEAEGRLNLALLQLGQRGADVERIKAELETIAMIWRRGEVEVRARARLSEIYAAESRWRDAFAMTRRAVEIQPEHPITRKLQDSTAQRFEALFLEGHADKLPRVEALAIHEEFRSLIPVGSKGDEIVRRLAERLYDLDLLDQAAELLAHQVNHRLKGVARSQTAARLAVVHLVNHKPQDALQVLKATRLSNLPPQLRRARVMLEARTLAELSRTELALETLAAETGSDIERLRADIHWRGRRWREASEGYEKSLAERWREESPLEDAERADVMRAAIGYALAADRLGLDRLRTKFLAKMSDSPDGSTFKLVTLDNISRSQDFREVARGAVSAQTMTDFLDAYRKRYPETAGGRRGRDSEAAKG